MLVIANGCNKCGSTWLASIILELVEHKPLPPGFHDARHGSVPTIKPDMLRQFLDEVDYQNETYVTKNHFYDERYLLSRHRNVFVVDIDRDMADMLISFFFHATPQMARASVEEVRRAYWRFGPPVVEYSARYHAIWGRKASWTYQSSYERLREDPRKEIAALAAFLGIPTTPERIERIIDETGFRRLAGKLSGIEGMERRFRKGIVGDHKNYFDEQIIHDIRRIEAENAGYPRTLFQKLDFALQCYRHAGRNRPPAYQPKLASALRAPVKA
jgi:hypothetical protein